MIFFPYEIWEANKNVLQTSKMSKLTYFEIKLKKYWMYFSKNVTEVNFLESCCKKSVAIHMLAQQRH